MAMLEVAMCSKDPGQLTDTQIRFVWLTQCFLKMWTKCQHFKIRRFHINISISGFSGNKAQSGCMVLPVLQAMKDPHPSPQSLSEETHTVNHRSPHHFLLSAPTTSCYGSRLALPSDLTCNSVWIFNPYLEFCISWNFPHCPSPLFPIDPYIASLFTSHFPFLGATALPDGGRPQFGYSCWDLSNLCCAKIPLWHRKHGAPLCLRIKRIEIWYQRVWRL